MGTATASVLAGCSVLGDGEDAATFYDDNWHQYGNSSKNTNRVAGDAPKPDEHEYLTSVGWTYAPPVIRDGVAYFTTERRVVAVAPDGRKRWSRNLDVEVSGAPALNPDRGRLYVPTRVVPTTTGPDPAPASVTVLSIADGEVIGAPRIGDDRTYGVSIFDGNVYARSATTCVRLAPDGTERWRRPLDPLIYDEYNLGDDTATQVAPAVTENGVYVPDRNALVMLDRETGKERWRVSVDTPYAASVVDDGGVIQAGWQETIAVNHSGGVRWRRDLHSIAAAAASDGDVYVAAGDLYELEAASGETNWQAHVSENGTAAPVVTDDAVFLPMGNVVAYRRDAGGAFGPDRKRWQTSSVNASAYSSLVMAAGHIFAAGPRSLLALGSGADG
ncbi:PQQ-binding-like beta-propeller repeat protein [Halosolutus halophilus]|uniref:outer membrane protein assembly factor BamB family protein n=1 Tax=Halosolutus halophilus TaxID=1552990 RepID=UPI0022350474|nr:PQQ-binding-like beta-propeller repeat protein [Halosolutus halophilus]